MLPASTSTVNCTRKSPTVRYVVIWRASSCSGRGEVLSLPASAFQDFHFRPVNSCELNNYVAMDGLLPYTDN